MIYSLKGHIAEIGEDWVAIDLGNIGYRVFVTHPNEYQLGEETRLLIHEVLTQDDHYLVGFPSKEERDAYLDLVSVKGIGPRTALGALSKTTPEEFYNAIASSNTAYLKKLPLIGPKAAAQIILDLKGKLVAPTSTAAPSQTYENVLSALKQLGFKKAEADKALTAVYSSSLDEQALLREALRVLGRK